MDDLELTRAQVYISMTINKLMFRKISMKRKGLSDESIKEVDYTIQDLNSSLQTFKTLELEYRVLKGRVFDLELHWLCAKKETEQQIKKNEELIKMI